jgi:hypothetical protein
MATFKLMLIAMGIFALSACSTGRDSSGMSNMGSSGSYGSQEATGNYVFGGNAGAWTRPATAREQAGTSGQ